MPTTRLLNTDCVRESLLVDAAWSDSHGAGGEDLGAGMIYYSLAYASNAKYCVCIGSGGGFVPRMMRQAQRDVGGGGETHIVDANDPVPGWGSPTWLDETSFLRRNSPELKIHLLDSVAAAEGIFAAVKIDYIHIDADHSYEGCQRDFEAYWPLLSPTGVMTIHDTAHHLQNDRCGVHRVVNELRQDQRVDIVDFPELGAGLCIVRAKPPKPRPWSNWLPACWR